MAIQTKTAIEIIAAVVGILVGAIAIYQFVYVPRSGVVKAARLADIASIIEHATGNKAVRLPQNYNLPLRMLYPEEVLRTSGINIEESERRGVTVIDEAGSALDLLELNVTLENKFGSGVSLTWDSSVDSIYADLFDE